MPKTSEHSCAFFFFDLLNTKSIKLSINPDDTKYLNIYMETSHIHIDQ